MRGLNAPAVGLMHTIEGSLGAGMSVFQRHFMDGKRGLNGTPTTGDYETV